MNFLVSLLAVAGFLAVLVRAGRALFVALWRGVDAFLARDLEQARAQRGDLTGLEEARVVRAGARRRRVVALSLAGLWIALLVVPILTASPTAVYALYSVLWLLPRRRRPT